MAIITVSTLGILSVAYDGGSPLPDESYIVESPDGTKWTVLASGTTGLITVTSGAVGDAIHPSFFDVNSVEWILTVDDTGILYIEQASGPVTLSPVGNEQFKFENGQMAEGYMMFVYEAGPGFVPAPVYKTKSFALTQPQPILLNAYGFPTDPIFIELGKFYKFILALPNSLDPPSSIVYEWDNINGGALINRAEPTEFSANSIAAEFVFETKFSVNGDQRLSFQLGRRVKCLDATTLYGTISTPSSFDGESTNVTLLMDSGALSADLTGVHVGTLQPNRSGIPNRLILGTRTKLAGGLSVPVSAGFNLLPAGIIIPYSVGGSVPAGWLLCDGASLLRASYTALFAAIDVAFGAADGDHFNVPDLRGRLPLGLDNLGGAALANRVTVSSLGGGDADIIGGDGGAETHALTVDEMTAHVHGTALLRENGAVGVALAGGVGGSSGNTASTGGGGAHNNMPPWIALNYLIHAQI